MLIGNNVFGDRVHISYAKPGDKYHCPLCNQELIQRRGEINIHHFAHRKNSSNSCDEWYYDPMTEWHSNWQNMFPVDTREVVVEYGGKKHRADVLINGTVVEFQHSRLSSDEFNARNRFYTAAGYRVVWLFDMIDDYKGRIRQEWYNENKYNWKYHWHTFDGFVPEDHNNVLVYFQLINDEVNGKHRIEHVVKMEDNNRTFYTDKNEKYDANDFVRFVNCQLMVKDPEIGRSILDIMKGSDKTFLIVKNIVNGKEAIIDNTLNYNSYYHGEIYGRLKWKDGMSFCNKRHLVYYWRRPVWILMFEK